MILGGKRGDRMTGQEVVLFDKLYRENVPQLIKFANYIVKNQAIAAEIVNEAFLILLQRFEFVKSLENPQGWLFIVVRNLAFNEKRKASYNEIPLEAIEDFGEEDYQLIPFVDSLPAGLTEEEKNLLVLRYEKLMSTKEIAQYLNISEASCRTKLSRAKDRYAQIRKREQEKFKI